jgi:hypothetical protein
VLSYRAISFWLPTPFGVVAYLQLRRTVARWRQAQSGHSVVAAPGGSAPAGGGALEGFATRS